MAAKAPAPTTIISHSAMASQGEKRLGGNDTPLVHNFGSFHTKRVSWSKSQKDKHFSKHHRKLNNPDAVNSIKSSKHRKQTICM